MLARQPITAGGGPQPADLVQRIDRPRFAGRLQGADTAPITLLMGPAGSGKSELLRSFRTDPDALFFRAGNEHATFARFVQGLARAVAPVAPGAQASFPRAWERALQSRSAGTVLAHWLTEHLGAIGSRLVIDDLHHSAADPNIATFIGKFAELRRNAPLTIAVRDPGALPIALWMATRRMDRPIGECELRFDRSEMAAAAKLFGVPLGPRAGDLRKAGFGGPTVAVSYALSRMRAERDRCERVLGTSFAEIASNIFSRRSGRERAFLFSAALFPDVDDALLHLSGWDDAVAIRAEIGSDGAFMWETSGAGELRFHDRFRDDLARRFAACDDDFRTTIARRTVCSLGAAGRHADALSVATNQRLTETTAELLDAHGFALLEAGNVDAIGEALDALGTSGRALGAHAMALHGYLEARSGRLDTSEAWFRLALDQATDETSQVAIATYYAHELALRRREDSGDVLAEFADSTTLPRRVLIDVQSSYAQALTAANRLDEAAARTDAVLALIDDDTPAALRARVYARAAYVALECGLPATARERALIAAPLAVSEALYDVAASTYSVLYNIAYEVDDDAVASLDYLRRLRDLGVKSGTLRLDLYALLGMYDLQAEAGNETALAELDVELAALDKHDATTQIMEGLVPAKVLQAGWAGRFDDGRRLLRATIEHHATAGRRAQCWARMALFHAAAGDRDAAAEATRNAADELRCAEPQTTRFELTLLTLALAAWADGDAGGAWKWTSAADRASLGTAPRLLALRAALGALIAGVTDEDRFAAWVADALARLWSTAFGGMARLIEALPYRFGFGPSETVLSRLARREFPRCFAAAVAAGDILPLRDWLEGVRGLAFTELPLRERFDRWAAAQTPFDAAAIATVRAQIVAYRAPVPAIIHLVDDIDASIDVLFEHLESAAPLMAEHSRAVSAWCSRIARAFGLSEAEIAFITRGGLIHDIGKMRTPPDILNAPRRLEPGEWVIMRDHAALGARIIGDYWPLAPFVPIVRGHHERIDGKGYPDGLGGAAIPLAARIVSVADSFNAMIGRRPYRSPLSPTEALAELERHSGTQFDPEIVEAMIRIVLGRVGSEPLPPHVA